LPPPPPLPKGFIPKRVVLEELGVQDYVAANLGELDLGAGITLVLFLSLVSLLAFLSHRIICKHIDANCSLHPRIF
jgi:hypothetical protein